MTSLCLLLRNLSAEGLPSPSNRWPLASHCEWDIPGHVTLPKLVSSSENGTASIGIGQS